MFRIVIAVIACIAGGISASAQVTASGKAEINILTLDGFEISTTFSFDAGYAAKYGVPVDVPFALSIPRHKDVRLIADGKPGGGFVKFTFATATEPMVFIENLHILPATIGMAVGAADPGLARLQTADRLMREQAFPMAVRGFQDPKLIGSREVSIGGLRAVELVGQYVDPNIGPMGLRILCVPNPARPESYIAVSNVNLRLVPLNGPEHFARSLAGRSLETFAYR